MAQPQGRNSLPWSKRIEFDLEYVNRVSLMFDLEIIVRSVPPWSIRGSGIDFYQTPDEVDDLGGTE